MLKTRISDQKVGRVNDGRVTIKTMHFKETPHLVHSSYLGTRLDFLAFFSSAVLTVVLSIFYCAVATFVNYLSSGNRVGHPGLSCNKRKRGKKRLAMQLATAAPEESGGSLFSLSFFLSLEGKDFALLAFFSQWLSV